ncbi:MAG: hypothetical protein HWQ38_13755 [Nostoc sp. NMS7]|nr:hypothetical protein [Nostoc sp. NMS7]
MLIPLSAGVFFQILLLMGDAPLYETLRERHRVTPAAASYASTDIFPCLDGRSLFFPSL